MSTPEPEFSDDDLLARVRPEALLARGLEESGSPPPSPTPPPPAGPSAGAREQNLGAATLGEMFPEFRFEGVISRGGFGTVYRAEHQRMKRRVAVKILSSTLTRNVSAVARFEREIAAIGTLDHPGIVRAFDAGQRGGAWFLAMELVEGADFSTLSRTLGPLPPAEACELVRQAALAIQHAHERDLIHRDVKPSNLMLTTGPDGASRVKVLDFGLAQLTHTADLGGELTMSGELLGTVDYIAPEQIANPRTVDARADVYGLGATLYRLLAGQAPHQASDSTSSLYAKLLRITHEACPGIATRCPELSPGLVAVVDRMVARDPDQRFATARDVAAALAPFAEAGQLPALLARVPHLELQESQEHLEPLPRPPRRRKFSRPAISLISLASLAVVSTAIFLVARKSPPSRVEESADPMSSSAGVVRVPMDAPRGLTLGADGALYGGTFHGGDFDSGVIYKFIAPTTFVMLAQFTGTNGPAPGHGPTHQLLLARDGSFYGVTELGGRLDYGTVFRFDPKRPDAPLTTLVEFEGPNGRQPRAGLIEDQDNAGVFYGGTLDGGNRNSGTIFRITTKDGSTRLETLIHFTGEAGNAPGRRLVAALAQTADGAFYGTTHDGGEAGFGTIFKLTAAGGFTSLASFGQPPLLLENPTGGLTLGLDGNLYGHCRYERGGAGGAFRLTPAGQADVIAHFGPPHGTEPVSPLFRGPDGSFYGTTSYGGANDEGTVYRLSPAGQLTTLAEFVDPGKAMELAPWGSPILADDGNLYGITQKGGAGRHGMIYRVTPEGKLTTLVEFTGPVGKKP